MYAILVTGILRSFHKHLLPFLNQLPDNYHIYISTNKDDESDRFLNKTIQLEQLRANPKIKTILVESDVSDYPLRDNMSQREKNTLYQWSRINNLFNTIPKIYDVYIRIRPDIKIECTIEDFMTACEYGLHSNTLLIPHGFNIFDSSFIPEDLHSKCINDQFAIGKYHVMSYYCNFIRGAATLIDIANPIISEIILFDYLHDQPIERIELPYRLILSDVFSLAICGDSGAGKSYISQLINEILPFDNTLLLETDRYHKWERGSKEYQTWTHLHPEANNLEKMSSDAYSLALGDDIYSVDYDHSTGKFTDLQKIQSNSFIIFCGLHTLYKESMRDICDLRIYVDTDIDLKYYWKIQRDTTVRGATNIQALQNTIERRRNDYDTFVAPQKDVADLIIRFKPRVPQLYDDLILEIELSTTFSDIFPIIMTFCQHSYDTNTNKKYFIFTDQSIDLTVTANHKFGLGAQNLKSGYAGIIQYIILLLLWKN